MQNPFGKVHNLTVETLHQRRWEDRPDQKAAGQAVELLEQGNVCFFPNLKFVLDQSEKRFLSPSWSDGKSKNISYDRSEGSLTGATGTSTDLQDLSLLLNRFAEQTSQFIKLLLPSYASQLEVARTSFRPVEIEERPATHIYDDTRLHIDAFPSRPTGGKRILRVFTNIDPQGQPRVWNIGEPFEAFAAGFVSRLTPLWPGQSWLLEHLGATRGRRTEYDHSMLQLHDLAKADDSYQRTTPRDKVVFAAESSWIAFTDQVVHSALSGQFALEQTFHIPVAVMQKEGLSPLRTLESLLGRQLV